MFQTHYHKVEVWKYASRFARLLQVGSVEDGKQYKLKKRAPCCFGLTTRAGILYVDNAVALQEVDPTETYK